MKLAYCGDVCSLCPRYLMTLSRSEDELKKVAILWRKIGWSLEKVKDPEKLKCIGCNDVEKCEYGVKECCLERNIENCGLCSDYPCSQIEKVFEITKGYSKKFKNILSEEEYEVFLNAFFSKKQNLDHVATEKKTHLSEL